MDADSRSQVIELKDYRPYPYQLKETHLEFHLDPKRTRVIAELHFDGEGYADLELDGEELRLISIAINDEELTFGNISTEDGRLTIDKEAIPTGAFVLRTEVEIDPSANSALSGLYISNDMFCTQCEAEGFRRITYFPDRPDVMSIFSVKIHSDAPVRLSNGNLVSEEKGYSEWHDPWPKPAYLFALVAGELKVVKDKFTTASGRKVDLRIYVRKGDETRCDYAMDALKRSMRWDEEAYGREYDLDLFMIVAVDDFNMGAMENKGLNIFNSRLVLASPETATDASYEAIESVIAHEYFHNWTGDRITCRDWFQLSLKEGLTVYRDQQFSAHERSEGVQRIKDVRALRSRQFQEDAGPLAHPVRPTAYEAIDNFYTATIYEKGAEVIGMMRTLVGAEDYRKATDLYFERHDGQACTIEDWVQVFADVTGRDFEQFMLWYAQAGTPNVKVDTSFDQGRLTINLEQNLAPTPGQPKKKPMLIPLRYALYNPNGDAIEDGLIELTEKEASFSIDAPEGAVLSINQGFSAPIYLDFPMIDAPFLLRHDQDPFNRWEAAQSMALGILADDHSPKTYIESIGEVIEDDRLEPNFRAQLLSLPSEGDVIAKIAAQDRSADPIAIAQSRKALQTAMGEAHQDALKRVYDQMRKADEGTVAPQDAGRRALAIACLNLISMAHPSCELAKSHFENSTLMTDLNGALAILIQHDQAGEALDKYFKTFENERLVIDNWISMQAVFTPANKVFETIRNISEMEIFENANPNRFRALYGGFAMANTEGFHANSGEGYQLLADVIVEYDARNPQTAARLPVAYQSYRYFDDERQDMVRSALKRIVNAKGLSVNTNEMVTRLLE